MKADLRALARVAVDALDDKRARDIAVLDLSGVSDTLDAFVIATGTSSVQIRALEESVLDRMRAAGLRPLSREGGSPRWSLLDFGAVVVHIMSPEAREFYDLEGLWADADRVDLATAN